MTGIREKLCRIKIEVEDREQQREMVTQYEERKSEPLTNAGTLHANLLARIWDRQAKEP